MTELSFGLFRQRVPIVRQAEAAECGLACVAMIAGFYGFRVSLPTLRTDHGISLKGATLRQIITIANDLELGTRALRCELEDLKSIKLPAILHWNLTHFVVLEKASRNGLHIIDPGSGREFVSYKQANEMFTGVAVECEPTKAFKEETNLSTLRLFDIIPFSGSFWSAIGLALFLSIFLQIFVLLSPLFMQFVIDEAILRSDGALLLAIAIGFSFFKIFEVLTTSVRALVLQYLTTIVSYDMESNVMTHLLQLPMSYFQKRFVGDVQQRFFSLQSIQRLVIDTAASTLIDGVLAATIGVALLIYSPKLALIVTGGVVIVAALKIFAIGYSKKLSMNLLITDAEEQSHFLETLRAMQTIKVSGLESQRQSKWRNLATDNLNAKIRLGNTNILLANSGLFILGGSNLIVVYLAAQQAMSGAITVGMIVAFIAYKQQFEQKLLSLLETFVQMRLITVQLERVADIVFTPAESEGTSTNPDQGNEISEVEFRSVSFRYNPTDTPVFENCSLSIQSGDFVVFVGPSGAGKSTILKLLAGIADPTSGSILFDGNSISALGGATIRKSMGIMMQDDQLLAGTIAQNISMFADNQDIERVQHVARLAEISDDIERMAMGYRSLVGDMGSTLSGGQVQRLMLARALYRNPSILIMDEGTSQLDVETERKINETLRELKITRIAAAHRPETIASADRIFRVSHGKIIETTRNMRSPVDDLVPGTA